MYRAKNVFVSACVTTSSKNREVVRLVLPSIRNCTTAVGEEEARAPPGAVLTPSGLWGRDLEDITYTQKTCLQHNTSRTIVLHSGAPTRPKCNAQHWPGPWAEAQCGLPRSMAKHAGQ